MKNIVIILALLISNSVFAQESVYGIWQFEKNSVFVIINKDNSTLQCRTAIGDTVIVAQGKLLQGPPFQINWEPITMTSKHVSPRYSINIFNIPHHICVFSLFLPVLVPLSQSVLVPLSQSPYSNNNTTITTKVLQRTKLTQHTM